MASANSLAGLMKWLERAEWQNGMDAALERHLAPACAKAGIAIAELAEVVGDHHATALWGCIFEDFLTCKLDDGRNIADDYLKRRGWNESASNKAYIAALRSSVMSLYEISDIVPEQSFLARDLVRGGEPVRVSERSGTRYLKQWDRMAARIVQTRLRTEMAGGTLLFDFETSEILLKALRRSAKKTRGDADRHAGKLGAGSGLTLSTPALTDTELLGSSAFLFTGAWLDATLQRILNPTLPQMHNADGEELVFTTVTYPLEPGTSVQAIRLALDSVPVLRPGSERLWNWFGARQGANPKQRTEGHTFFTTLDDGSLGLGTVELKGKTLVLEANSPQRAERGRALLAPVLRGIVGEPVMKTTSVAQLMASRPAEKSKPRSSGLPPDQERAIVQANLDLYYMDLLDEPVPALGNITPRRAARSGKTREKLVCWLKLLENSAAKLGKGETGPGYDVSWIWLELGIADLRR